MGVLMSDLSYKGCKISVNKDLLLGDQITIGVFELGNEVSASVQWDAVGKLDLRSGEGALTLQIAAQIVMAV